MRMVWNISTGQLGLAAWLHSLPGPAHMLISWIYETGKSPWFLSNNWKHQCYPHSSGTKSKKQQLQGGKLSLLKPGHLLTCGQKLICHLWSSLQWLSFAVIFTCALGTSEGNSACQMAHDYILHVTDRQNLETEKNPYFGPGLSSLLNWSCAWHKWWDLSAKAQPYIACSHLLFSGWKALWDSQRLQHASTQPCTPFWCTHHLKLLWQVMGK